MTNPSKRPKLKPKVNPEQIQAAEQIIGLKFTDSERELMLEELSERLEQYKKLREISLGNNVPPALHFNPNLDGVKPKNQSRSLRLSNVPDLKRPKDKDLEELAFYPVTHLAKLIKSRKVSSMELTEMYLDRLKRFDPKLKCVVTLTEDLALKQAKRADREIAKGKYRGTLHGIPWGAKDLLAVKGYPTTWGAKPYKDQIFNYDAAVVERLEEAGAVLLGKLTTGSLAYGDVWFGGTTKSPWNLKEGSSGSSAGPASAAAGGLVGFSIGSETLGSIVSPSHRCGTTGLRPTFGRVSRHGVMALSWSMDKIGPICRAVEDCAVVFNSIYGPDPRDMATSDHPFSWDVKQRIKSLKIGYVKSAFEKESDSLIFDKQTLKVLKSLGVKLVPIELPDLPWAAMRLILVAEAAAAFDDLTRSNKDDLLARQAKDSWPNLFRMARLIPAVEYIQANRVRTLLMRQMMDIFKTVDVYVCPSFRANNLTLTNLTGHPCVVIPNGFSRKGTPASSITFMGQLYHEGDVLTVAKALQDATDFHKRQPKMNF
ncbi:amidase [Candidatus Acetothermia bacterium]|nr:amidase [Candidatus Acetothermia bacterium]MBI3643678.1 amidase [Candidatus Acetothermia bacterium]